MLSKVTLLGLLLSTLFKVSAGQNGCGKEHIFSTAITTELQSDVMLPCYFNLSILGSREAEDVVVVWSQTDSAVHNLAEITISGVVRHWDSKNKRIKTFPELSASGNFSIVLQNAQFSDKGLYRCELFKGINCIVAYQEHNLNVTQCRREMLTMITITTEMQSDVLLPCYFNPYNLGSEPDVAVVWSQTETTVRNLNEININGDVRHWDSKDRRIKVFPELSASGNFSLVLQKAQFSDQGLYRCELFNGINCLVAYQELNLSVTWCKQEKLTRINITTELQSDVLLPCYFKPSILGSDTRADIAAVWSQRNLTTDNLLEISLHGNVMSWKNQGGRIHTFPSLSVSGNFSILLRNAQQSDLGLYRCELFKGISCALAHQEIYIGTASEASMKIWLYILGAAITLCLLVMCLFFTQWKKKSRSQENSVYVNWVRNKM